MYKIEHFPKKYKAKLQEIRQKKCVGYLRSIFKDLTLRKSLKSSINRAESIYK